MEPELEPAVTVPEGRRSRKFVLGRQSSLAPERDRPGQELQELPAFVDVGLSDSVGVGDSTSSGGMGGDGLELLYLANKGDVDSIRTLLDGGLDVNSRDFDDRTALHVAACEGHASVVDLLIRRGANLNAKDRWESTPLADAIHYQNEEVRKLLEEHGAYLPKPPMRVTNERDIPEYEVDPKEIDFTKSQRISKGTYQLVLWRGIQVAVKRFTDDILTKDEKVQAFRDELTLLQKVRHPNVVQFLGAVTQSIPMMIITEYLPKGDLSDYLSRKGALKPAKAVKFALDIARGMNYLHENKPAPIIHRDLKPPNILRDESGHLKVADFGISKLLKVPNERVDDGIAKFQGTSWRYMAPEVCEQKPYDIKVDVFSFALVLQEMIEGSPPFASRSDPEAVQAYINGERPPFKASQRHYPHGLRDLIEQCWSPNPTQRPTFAEIIPRLDAITYVIKRKNLWKVKAGKYFRKVFIHSRNSGDHSGSSTI